MRALGLVSLRNWLSTPQESKGKLAPGSGHDQAASEMSEEFPNAFRPYPYWWEQSPRPKLPPSDLPASVDVVVVGSGYTGLNAALQTARGGRSTLVFDAEAAGFGCSTRNGGQISTSIKPGFSALSKRYGEQTAFAILKEGHDALSWIGHFLDEEGIDCDFKVPGRFHAAHSARRYEKLAREIENQPKGLEVPAHVVPRSEQRRELGTDVYHGGVVFEAHASLDPGRFHAGLLQKVLDAGAAVRGNCPVTRIDRQNDGFLVNVPGGKVKARDVVIATNGYTGTLSPWQRRRVIPIGSYVIATDRVDPTVMADVMPGDRVVSDSRKVVYYYRPSPDRSRILFGGRVTNGEVDPRLSGTLLRRELLRLFPQLDGIGVSHSWMGRVAYTFGTMAHLGRHDGMYYAMGYCGSGVSMASYLGMKTGLQVLGRKEGRSPLQDTSFSTRPLYTGKPWFLPASVAWYRLMDATGL